MYASDSVSSSELVVDWWLDLGASEEGWKSGKERKEEVVEGQSEIGIEERRHFVLGERPYLRKQIFSSSRLASVFSLKSLRDEEVFRGRENRLSPSFSLALLTLYSSPSFAASHPKRARAVLWRAIKELSRSPVCRKATKSKKARELGSIPRRVRREARRTETPLRGREEASY